MTQRSISNAPPLLEMRGISKRFGGIQALDGVDFSLRRGEVMALIGENGAGKSTLIKILAGVYQRDAGEILFDCHPIEIRNPGDAQRLGVAVIYQEFNLTPNQTVAEEDWATAGYPAGPHEHSPRRGALRRRPPASQRGWDGTVRLWETRGSANVRILRAEQRYERLDITSLTGVTEAQRVALLALGAVDQRAGRRD